MDYTSASHYATVDLTAERSKLKSATKMVALMSDLEKKTLALLLKKRVPSKVIYLKTNKPIG